MTNELVSQIKTISPSLFQQTDKNITVVGLGGEGVLRTTGKKSQAQKLINAAVDHGITYYDSARVYMDSELYYGEVWKQNPEMRKKIFHTSKSARRSKQGALDDLTQTLERLNTTYLDLWQIHDVRDEKDLHIIGKKGGALEGFIEAREKGLVKHIGVTGHHDPQILTRAIEQWPVDSVLMPVNPVEEIIGGFLTQTLEAAHKKGIAIIGMKVLGGKHYVSREMGITAALLVRFALSHEITLAIVGCSSVNEVSELAGAGKTDRKLSLDERKEIMKPYMQMAQELAYYRGSVFNKI